MQLSLPHEALPACSPRVYSTHWSQHCLVQTKDVTVETDAGLMATVYVGHKVPGSTDYNIDQIEQGVCTGRPKKNSVSSTNSGTNGHFFGDVLYRYPPIWSPR